MKQLSRRKKLLLWVVTGIGAPILYLAWGFIRAADPISISKETTWQISPVHSSGYVDFTEEMNRQRNVNVPQNAALDDREYIAAVGAIDTLIAPLKNRERNEVLNWPPEVDKQLDRLIAFQRNNLGVIDIPEIPNGARFQVPALESRRLQNFGDQILAYHRSFVPSLLKRASYRLFQNDAAGALDDYVAASESQAFQFRQKSLLPVLFGIQIHEEITADLARNMHKGRMSPEQCRGILLAGPTLSRNDIQATTNVMRMNSLNWVFLMHSRQSSMSSTIGPVGTLDRWLRNGRDRWMVGNTDWNEICRHINQYFDQADTHVVSLYDDDREPQTIPTWHVPENVGSWAWTRRGMTNVVRKQMSLFFENEWPILVKSNQKYERCRVGFWWTTVLHEHFQQSGEYPASLEELGQEKPEIQKDTTVMQESVEYTKTERGYSLSMGHGKYRMEWAVDGGPPERVSQ